MQSHIQPVTQQFRLGNTGLMAASRNASRDAVLEQVVALGRARVVTVGTAIHRAGDPFRSVFFVKSGAAKRMLIQEDGREQILGFPMPGDIVGMEAIDGGVHTTTVIALDLCAVVEIPFEAIEALAAENPAVSRFLYHRMSAALRDEGWPQVHDADRKGWSLWFQANGITEVRTARGPSFDDSGLLLKAVLTGQGAGLLPAAMVANSIESGELIQLLETAHLEEFAYYLVCPDNRQGLPKIAAYREWILGPAAQSALGER